MHFPRIPLGSLLLAGMMASMQACRTDPPVPPSEEPGAPMGTLRITVIPEWQGEPLEFYHEYRNVSDYRTTVEFLKFYWSDLRLIDGMDVTPLSTVEYFDMQHGPVTKEWKVQPGAWIGLRTGLGLPHDLNYSDPALYPAEHPLSVNTGMYWTWATGYKFVLFDGRYDPDPASTAPLITGYSLHTGMDTCYMEMDLFPVLPIVVAEDSVTSLVVHVAVDEFFHSNFGTIDLATENQSHLGNVTLALKFSHNVVQSFTME